MATPKLIPIKRARFHESIQAFGESITFYPLNKYVNRFKVFLDPKLMVLVMTDSKESIEIPLPNVVYYERKKSDKSTDKKDTKPTKVV
jgi:hypothetical protein